MSVKFVTGLVRFSYPHLFKPHAFAEGADPKYSVTVMIPKTDTKEYKRWKAAQDQAFQEGLSSKWQGKAPAKWAPAIHDGDVDADLDKNPELKGMWYMNVKSDRRPTVLDKDKIEIFDAEDVYGGCYGRVSMAFAAFNNNLKGVGAYLNHVQKLKDGDPFGAGRSSAEDDFADDIDLSGFEDEEDDF